MYNMSYKYTGILTSIYMYVYIYMKIEIFSLIGELFGELLLPLIFSPWINQVLYDFDLQERCLLYIPQFYLNLWPQVTSTDAT